MLTLMLIFVPEDEETLKCTGEPSGGQDYGLGSWGGSEPDQDGNVHMALQRGEDIVCACVIFFILSLQF